MNRITQNPVLVGTGFQVCSSGHQNKHDSSFDDSSVQPKNAVGDEAPRGCAVCNPKLDRPLEEVLEERRREISEVMHVVHMGDGYHILQVPGDGGKPFEAWSGPFESDAAARLFRMDLVETAAEGNPGNACCSFGIFEHFNLAGRILEIIESCDGDARQIANEIASRKPWEQKPETDPQDCGIPF